MVTFVGPTRFLILILSIISLRVERIDLFWVHNEKWQDLSRRQ